MITLDDEEIQIAKAEAYRLSWTHKVHPKSEKEKYLLKAQLKKVVDGIKKNAYVALDKRTGEVELGSIIISPEFWQALLKEVED